MLNDTGFKFIGSKIALDTALCISNTNSASYLLHICI